MQNLFEIVCILLLHLLIVPLPGGLLSFQNVVLLTYRLNVPLQRKDLPALLGFLHPNQTFKMNSE
jgi:hypothetical protein